MVRTQTSRLLWKLFSGQNWETEETVSRDIPIIIPRLQGSRAYLEKNMTYSTASDPDTKDGDFVEHLLTDTKIGHSVHYASAAALMFRYYGIPSRYVEGYLVTPEDVRDKKSGDTIEIPAKTATHGQRSTLTVSAGFRLK